MLSRIKTWLIAFITAVAGFFYLKSHTANKAKERVEKELESEKKSNSVLSSHTAKTQKAITENQSARAEASKQISNKKRNHFEKGM